MDWNKLKETIYFEDGSLRDIYVQETTIQDWHKWIEHVNSHYTVAFYNGRAQRNEEYIDFEVIKDFWAGKHDLLSTVTISISNIKIKAHFFVVSEIENDIQPREIQSLDDHTALLNDLNDISNALNKPVILTEKNAMNHILLAVHPMK
jgi:hypothetical protein